VRDGRALVACTVDHRAVDGGDVGRFLAAFKSALEARVGEAVRAG
jgi:pyruvate/2-oxoglutarate dehydrogenase complex dihydrolipoamide acyltransferase (E2) component